MSILLSPKPENFVILVAFALLAIFFTYFSIKGYELHKYRNVVVEIDENKGIIISEGTKVLNMLTEDLLYKNYKMLTMIELYDRNGNKIAAFDHIHPNVKVFLEWAKDNLEQKK